MNTHKSHSEVLATFFLNKSSKHNHKNVKTLSSFHAYAYVAIVPSEVMLA